MTRTARFAARKVRNIPFFLTSSHTSSRVAHKYPVCPVRTVSTTPNNVHGVIRAADAVVVSITFETLCLQKVESGTYRYNPPTELGWFCLDLRRLRSEPSGLAKPGSMPLAEMGHSHLCQPVPIRTSTQGSCIMVTEVPVGTS